MELMSTCWPGPPSAWWPFRSHADSTSILHGSLLASSLNWLYRLGLISNLIRPHFQQSSLSQAATHQHKLLASSLFSPHDSLLMASCLAHLNKSTYICFFYVQSPLKIEFSESKLLKSKLSNSQLLRLPIFNSISGEASCSPPDVCMHVSYFFTDCQDPVVMWQSQASSPASALDSPIV